MQASASRDRMRANDSHRRATTGGVTSAREDLRHRRRPGRRDDRSGAPRRARADRLRPRRGAARRDLAALRRPHRGGQRRQPARALGGGHHRGRPADRLHLARRVEHRRGDDLEGLLAAARRPSSARPTRSTSRSGAKASSTSTSSSRPRSRPRYAISRTIGVPGGAADRRLRRGPGAAGRVRRRRAATRASSASPLREARIPPDSRVAAIIRGDDVVIPRGDEVIRPGDRIVVIGSPQAAQAWSELIAPGTGKVRDVVIFGAGRAGTAIARLLLEQGIGVRMIEASRERARVRRRRAARRARLPRDRLRPGLPRARADRRRPGRDLRDARRHEEPLRGHARQGARRRASRSRSSTTPPRWRCSSTRVSTSPSTRAR